jgi:hypothetical protein
MKNTFELGLVGVAMLGLAACGSVPGTLSPTATQDVSNVLAVACPVLGTLAGKTLTGNQNLAYNTLSIACPPNAAPTNAVQVAIDLIAAFDVLAPKAGLTPL